MYPPLGEVVKSKVAGGSIDHMLVPAASQNETRGELKSGSTYLVGEYAIERIRCRLHENHFLRCGYVSIQLTKTNLDPYA